MTTLALLLVATFVVATTIAIFALTLTRGRARGADPSASRA